jgi:hypothetical protein
MKNTITTLLCLLLFSTKLLAQEEMQISKNAVTLDFSTFDHQVYSLNYERAFTIKHFAVVPKVGIYIHPYGGGRWFQFENAVSEPQTEFKTFNSVNLGVDFIYGKSKHFVELGINTRLRGDLYISERREAVDIINYGFEPRIGYRFQPKKQGVFGRILFRPVFIDSVILTGPGIEPTRKFFNGHSYQLPPRRAIEFFTFGIGYSF